MSEGGFDSPYGHGRRTACYFFESRTPPPIRHDKAVDLDQGRDDTTGDEADLFGHDRIRDPWHLNRPTQQPSPPERSSSGPQSDDLECCESPGPEGWCSQLRLVPRRCGQDAHRHAETTDGAQGETGCRLRGHCDPSSIPTLCFCVSHDSPSGPRSSIEPETRSIFRYLYGGLDWPVWPSC